jgi:hemoglobin
MELHINSYQLGERPDVTKPIHEFYKELGEDGIRKMVSQHYDLLRASKITHLFSRNDDEFEMSKQHSADFMIQICGGTDYYNQRRGKPMLINRHAPFQITPEARIIWLTCYKQVLLELEISDESLISFWDYLNVFSAWMVNRPAPTTPLIGGKI